MAENRFYICKHCGNIIGKIYDAGVPVVCCGEKMAVLEAGAVEASREKHIPVVKLENNTVTATVGSVLHPMTEEHNISWVYLETNLGGQRKGLNETDAPEVKFALSEGEKPVAVYAYCNLHGLWKADV